MIYAPPEQMFYKSSCGPTCFSFAKKCSIFKAEILSFGLDPRAVRMCCIITQGKMKHSQAFNYLLQQHQQEAQQEKTAGSCSAFYSHPWNSGRQGSCEIRTGVGIVSLPRQHQKKTPIFPDSKRICQSPPTNITSNFKI